MSPAARRRRPARKKRAAAAAAAPKARPKAPRFLAELEESLIRLHGQGAVLVLSFAVENPESRDARREAFVATVSRDARVQTADGARLVAMASTSARAWSVARAVADALALWGAR